MARTDANRAIVGGMGERLYSLQVLRGLAACAVVVLHATAIKLPVEPERWRFDTGAAGVDVFFVLSGVIISLVASGSAARFLLRRAWRIVPLFWILAAIQTVLLAGQFQWFNYATTLTFWPSWGSGFSTPIIAVGWTLCFEMLFYACAAVILVDGRAIWPLAALFVTCWIGRVVTGYPALQFLGNPIIIEFVIGAAIGLLWRRGWRIGQASSVFLIASGAALIFLLAQDPAPFADAESTRTGEDALRRVAEFGLPASLVVLGFLNLKFAWPQWLIATGDASYSIYLAHSVALSPFQHIYLPEPLQTIRVLFYLFVAFAASFFVYQWIEKPLLEVARRRRALEAAAPMPAIGAVD